MTVPKGATFKCVTYQRKLAGRLVTYNPNKEIKGSNVQTWRQILQGGGGKKMNNSSRQNSPKTPEFNPDVEISL